MVKISIERIIMKNIFLLSSVAAVFFLGGCASPPQNPNVYRTGEVGVVQHVRYATIVSVRPVTIDAGSTGVGLGTGAVVGGVAGSAIGGGHGSGGLVGGVIGAVAGGIAGQAIERNTSQKPGVEITVRTDYDQTLVIVQPDDGSRFRYGDRVRLVGNGRDTRVTY